MSQFFRSLVLAVAAHAVLSSTGPGAEPGRVWRRQALMRVGKQSPAALAFAPDGKTLVVGGLDGTVTLWNARTGKFQGTLRRRGRAILTLAFAGEGKSVIAVGQDATVMLWDVASKRQQKTFRTGRGALAVAAISPDGKLLAVVANAAGRGRACLVRLWNLDTAKPGRSLAGHAYPAYAAQFSADGKRLLTVGPRNRTRADGPGIGSDLDTTVSEVKVWNVAGGRGVTVPARGNVFSLSPDARTVVVSVQDARTFRFRFEVWDVATKKRRAAFGQLGQIVMGTDLSPDGKTFATIGYGHSVRLWDVVKGRPRAILRGPREPAQKVLFSCDGRLLAAAGSDGAVYVWSSGKSSKQKSPGGKP